MKRRSKEALWATSTAPPRNSSRQGRTTSIGSASATIPLVMPVRALISGGIETSGLTRVWKVPRTSPPRILTAPTSVMRSLAADPPVVSRSRTTNSTSSSGVPRSSRRPWSATDAAGIPAVPFVRSGLRRDARRTRVRGQAPRGTVDGRRSGPAGQDGRAEAEGQEPEGEHGGQPFRGGHGQHQGRGQAGEEERGGGGPDDDLGEGWGLDAAATHGPSGGEGDVEVAGGRRLDNQPAPEHDRARGPVQAGQQGPQAGKLAHAQEGGGADGDGLAAAVRSGPVGQPRGQRRVAGGEGDGGAAGQVLAAGGRVAGGAMGVGQGQLGGEGAWQQVGGGEQAQGLGAALGVVGGPLEAGHRLADPAGGHVLATGLDQLVGSHRVPPACWPPRGPR